MNYLTMEKVQAWYKPEKQKNGTSTALADELLIHTCCYQNIQKTT